MIVAFGSPPEMESEFKESIFDVEYLCRAQASYCRVPEEALEVVGWCNAAGVYVRRSLEKKSVGPRSMMQIIPSRRRVRASKRTA